MDFDRANIRTELRAILRRTQSVAATAREEFSDGTASYDIAGIAIIRLASLTERAEFAIWMKLLTKDEVLSIRATRNIVAHAGYASMDDDRFWDTVTKRVPELIERLLSSEE
ncbi:HepT-like ribonuclease domain-containing protein [Brevibacterium sediminis]|uniref:HepT-like ribonuclease domain-containing protein n=1 Tax=Brevibacterium sediminis TaxID=1857024 RepID=UPI001C5842B2|nr:HepT-like ribonuclease domain-containing protein [Brevibacterium sediminis]